VTVWAKKEGRNDKTHLALLCCGCTSLNWFQKEHELVAAEGALAHQNIGICLPLPLPNPGPPAYVHKRVAQYCRHKSSHSGALGAQPNVVVALGASHDPCLLMRRVIMIRGVRSKARNIRQGLDKETP